jgi:hypothetical protein
MFFQHLIRDSNNLLVLSQAERWYNTLGTDSIVGVEEMLAIDLLRI